jgi:alkylated DNA repair dioxygenase AlkB
MAEIVFKYKTSYLSILQIDRKKIKLIDKCVAKMYELNVLIEKPEIKIMGRICHQQRNICNFSDVSEGYKYSGQIAKSTPLPECFKKLLEYINELFDSDFNSILVNEYVGGSDCIGRHSDNEKELDSSAGVIALSIGESRKFRIRKKGMDKDEDGKEHLPPILFEHETQDYEIMQMGGDFQKQLTHEIPAQKKLIGTRISFTFRKFV